MKFGILFCGTEIFETRIVPSVVRRWGGAGGVKRAGRGGYAVCSLRSVFLPQKSLEGEVGE